MRPVVAAGLVSVCVAGFAAAALPASALACPNERFRTGASAALPDCRAYELVTPANLGRAQDLVFNEGKGGRVIPSSEGEQLALESLVPIEPDASAIAGVIGTRAVFSRTAAGWTMRSMIVPGMRPDKLDMRLFGPDLSQVAFESYTELNNAEISPDISFEVGPVGGPYRLLADVPRESFTFFQGANNGTASVPAFTDVVFSSTDHGLLAPGLEGTSAGETTTGAPDLYEWTGGPGCGSAASSCQLVNVEGEGSDIKLINKCGAVLGEGPVSAVGEDNTVDAISVEGSKVFFKTPHSGKNCEGPSRLYMRSDGRETVEVSAPQGIAEPSERGETVYRGATPDGSVVFFSTSTVLMLGVTAAGEKLYAYDTEAPIGHRLTLVAGEISSKLSGYFALSEDGSVVYAETANHVFFRYDKPPGSGTWESSFVAQAKETQVEDEPISVTPNGEFLLFPSVGGGSGSLEEREGVRGEPRGAGAPDHSHNELYRYDNANRSVMCVSCGEGVVPENGTTIEPGGANSVLSSTDGTPSVVAMSEDGRRVFFQTSAQLLPQDTNESKAGETELGVGADVYEWEEDGAEEAPGVFCGVANGCTHLMTAGEDVGPSNFLGASANGDDVFFASAAQLVPQATPEFTNIYDARVDGGFPPPPPRVECTSCQGVGSPPPLFGPGASLTFTGTGNPAPTMVSRIASTRRTAKHCAKGKKRRDGRCIKAKTKGGAKRKSVKYHNGMK